MVTMLRTSLVLASLLCSLLAHAAGDNRIVVMPFALSSGVDKQKGALLDEIYLAELGRLAPKTVRILSAADMATMLGQVEQKKLIGCDDTSCLVEIGNAIGANQLISSSIGKVGDNFVVSTKLISMAEAVVLFRDVVYLGTSEAELVNGIKQLTRALAVSQGWIVATPLQPLALVAASAPDASPAGTSVLTGEPERPRPLLISGIAAAAVGTLALAGCGIGALVVDGQLADYTQPAKQRADTATLGAVMLGGTALGGLVALAGAVLTVLGVL